MKYVVTFFTLLLVYLFLTSFAIEELILGSVVSIAFTYVLVNRMNFKVDWKFPIRLIKFIVIYIPVFIYKLVLANLDVARRVLSLKVPVNPGIIKVKTSLKGDLGKLTLANSITLTPGTLSIDVEGDDIYVHAIDIKQGEHLDQQKNISGSFEKILGGIFE